MAYELVAGDGGTTLRVTVVDSATSDPVDLTGKTVKLRYSLNGAASVEKTMTAMDQTASKGKANYLFLTTDVIVGGTIKAEIVLNKGASTQLTSVDTFHIKVKDPSL